MRYVVLLLTNAAAMTPFAFFALALPVILREAEVPLRLIGLTSLVYLPVIFVFVWAPLIDNHALNRLGKRRSWMAVSFLLMVGLCITIAVLNPGRLPIATLCLGMLLGVLAVSARTAMLGYSVDALDESERSTGSVFLLVGSAIASLTGASGLLLIYEWFGWSPAMLAMALLIALPLVPVVWVDEPVVHSETQAHKPRARLSAFFQRAYSAVMLRFLLCLGMAVGFGFGMLPPLLVDAGFETENIAFINATLTFGGIMIAGPIAAFVVRRLSLRSALVLGFALNVIVYAYAATAAQLDFSRLHAAASLGLIFFAFSFLGVMTNTVFMNYSDAGQESTDMSVIFTLYMLISILAAGVSGFLAQVAGYSAVFFVAAAFTATAWWVSTRLSTASAQVHARRGRNSGA